MFSTLLTATFLAATVLKGVVAEPFAVSNPEAKACGDTYVSWQNTYEGKSQGSYYVYVVDPDHACDKELMFVGEFQTTETTFKTTLPEGTNAQIYIENDLDGEAWSAPFKVGKGSTDCLPAEQQPNKPVSSSPAAAKPTSAATSSGSQSTGKPQPVGAANANGLFGGDENAAPSTRQLSGSVLALTAAAVFAALAL